MSEISRATLRKVVPEANMFRQYSVAVSLDLFGQPVVTCAWGRIGARGQELRRACASAAEAEGLAKRLVQRQLRRGYADVNQRSALGAAHSSAALPPSALAAPSRRAACGPPSLRRVLKTALTQSNLWRTHPGDLLNDTGSVPAACAP